MGKRKGKKKFFAIIKFSFFFIIVLLVAGYIYFNLAFPKTTLAPNVQIYSSPQQIQRGKYLANHVTVCISCHSSRDWSKFSGPIIPGTEGMGGEKFEKGYPGTFYASNITPSGIGEWTDGEVLRVITTGVTRDERVLYPLMPYLQYQNLNIEDLYSIVGYIRTIKPIVNEVPVSSINFPMNLIVKTYPPKSYTPVTAVSDSTSIQYGKYLATIAVCKSCHTSAGENSVNDMIFAGGREFVTDNGIIRSSNVTPDIETGIGSWTRDDFLQKFKQYANQNINVNRGDINTSMPWSSYSGMTDNDLTAIYNYLKTIPPVHNKITRLTVTKN